MEAKEIFEQTSIESLTSKADAGDLPSQNHLGYLYYNGMGVKQDYEKAINWYRKAAKQA
jgi:TPR repeat protein